MGESGMKCKVEFVHSLKGESWVNTVRKENAGKVSNKLYWLSTYGNEMSGLGFFQFVPQPVKILVSSTNRIFWQVKLHPSTLQMRTVEQNQGKGRVAYLGRMEGKKLSLNNLGKNTLFFHQTHQPNGRAYQHGMTSPGHGVQLKISRI